MSVRDCVISSIIALMEMVLLIAACIVSCVINKESHSPDFNSFWKSAKILLFLLLFGRVEYPASETFDN